MSSRTLSWGVTVRVRHVTEFKEQGSEVRMHEPECGDR